MTPKEVIALAKAKDVAFVELRHCTPSGQWHRVALPVAELTETLFDKGLAAEAGDAFSQAGRLWPDPSTAGVDPFAQVATLTLLCDRRPALDGGTGLFCPRAAARRARDYLGGTGVAERVNVGLETAFYLFPAEGGRAEGAGLAEAAAAGDPDLRNQIVQTLMELGLKVHAFRGSCGSERQVVGLHQEDMLKAADAFCALKHVVRQVALRRDRSATFMPLPRYGQPGCGLEISLSLIKDKRNIMAGKGGETLSGEALGFMRGLVRHAPALCALTAPTSNSYKRIGAGPDSPVYASDSGPGAVCGVPEAPTPQHTRVSYCGSDASANPYLAFAAILMAGLDGILGAGVGGSTSAASNGNKIPRLPGSLRAALEALEADHDFLLEGGVFNAAFIQKHIESKQAEQEAIRRRPHPHEFVIYYDV